MILGTEQRHWPDAVALDTCIFIYLIEEHPLYLKTVQLQIAAALDTGCSSFITNDKRLPDIPGLAIIQLGDLP